MSAFAQFFEAASRRGSSSASAPSSSERKKKKKRRKNHEETLFGDGGDRKKKKKKRQREEKNDPSSAYLGNPKKCPTVRRFRAFFNDVCANYSIPPAKVVCGPKEGWRTVAKLSVRENPKTKKAVIGIFAPRSHRVVPLLKSAAHHPSINRAVNAVQASANALRIKGYDGVNHGGLSYIGCTVETSTKLVQLVLVWNASSAKNVNGLDAFVKDLEKRHRWFAIWNHFHKASRHDNSIYGREGATWSCAARPHSVGAPVREMLTIKGTHAKPHLRFPPQVFRQANLAGFCNIIIAIRRWMLPGRCVELYGGVGTIGLNILDLVSELSCSDANPFNEACFLASLAEMGDKAKEKATYTSLDASAMAIRGELTEKPVDVAIVDPPRKGLDEAVLSALEKAQPSRPRRIVYVSCGFKAFQRDYRRLTAAGYAPKHVEGHVLFPGSDHIETLCIFDDDNRDNTTSL